MLKNKCFSIVVLVLFCALVSCQTAIAEQQTVKLTVPGCKWTGTAARVGSILNSINGVAQVATDPANHTATVTFDTTKTTVDAIKKALADGDFPAEGEPQIIKN